jgi:hypothetical protein
MQARYRREYDGEFIITKIVYENGESVLEKEWVPNTINNINTTWAVVLGNGRSILDFNIAPVFIHRGGYKGQRRLQSYGCNALYRKYEPNFLIATSDVVAKEMVESGYTKDHVVMAHKKHVKKYPNEFHLIPFDEYKDAGTTALRIACFDGHHRVYMLGFDGQNMPHENNNVFRDTPGYNRKDEVIDFSDWEKNLLEVMQTYPDVEFVRVTYRDDYPLPTELLNYANNFRSITYRQFVIETDLGC